MAQARRGDRVRVDYTGRLDDGTVFDSSESQTCGSDCDPLNFSIGEGMLIPGFEEAVIGMTPGERKTVKIAAGEAYGEHREELVAVVDRKEFPETLNLQLGMELEVDQGQGETFSVVVKEMTESHVTLDANHPLAGKDLTFDIKLVEIG